MFDDLAEWWLFREKTKIVLGIFGLLFLSMVMSCQELRYMVSGKTMDVSASTRLDYFERDGQKYVHKVLQYSYIDGTETRQNFVDVPMNFALSEQSTVKIQYVPGHDRSRIQGQSNKVWVYIFFGSLAAGIVGAIILAKTG